MDGLNGTGGDQDKVVMVLAATNYPWHIDEAFRRRFEKRIHIGLPTTEARKGLLDINLQKMQVLKKKCLDQNRFPIIKKTRRTIQSIVISYIQIGTLGSL